MSVCLQCLASLDLTYAYAVNEQFDVTIGGLVGFAGADMSAGGESGANEWEIKLGGEYALSDATALTAFLAYTDALDDQVLPTGVGAQDINFYGGLGVVYDF